MCVYNNEAKLWTVYHPDGQLETQIGIDAFIDDSAQILALEKDVSLDELHQAMQDNSDLWNGLITATVGALNPTKGCCSIFCWSFEDEGTPYLLEPGEMDFDPLTMKITNGKLVEIRQTKQTDAVRLLGVRIAMDGNSMAEEKAFKTKCDAYLKVLGCNSFTPEDAHTVYYTSFAPSIRYPLPATFMNMQRLKEMQRQITNAFLSAMGYNCHPPRAVVFGTTNFAGYGLFNLPVEQGIEGTVQLIKHIRSGTELGGMYEVMIKDYQLSAGTGQHVLQDTRHLPHAEAFWLNAMRAFLHEISAKIELDTEWTISSMRDNDQHIMDAILNSNRYTNKLAE